ncbi:MAG: thiamine-phosphate kinase, partial [Gammaproteobacteria bacterium]|nr:thiamine-phosphate kinase [Gammaproteobacteria bacterium]
MAVSEFDLIKDYFNRPGLVPTPEQSERIPLGIGDDCALLELPPEKLLAVSMDTLVADVHFPAKADSELIAQRALAVNLSDLAAMGAEPLAFTLALTLPKAESTWLEGFSRGLQDIIQRYQCPLIGGDITKGPLSITIQVHGLVDKSRALTRNGASIGDLVFVSGELGAAGLAL